MKNDRTEQLADSLGLTFAKVDASEVADWQCVLSDFFNCSNLNSVCERFRSECDSGSYGPVEWMRALVAFRRWLNQTDQSLSFSDQFDYLRCVVASISDPMLTTLSAELEAMLEKYGCDRAK